MYLYECIYINFPYMKSSEDANHRDRRQISGCQMLGEVNEETVKWLSALFSGSGAYQLFSVGYTLHLLAPGGEIN